MTRQAIGAISIRSTFQVVTTWNVFFVIYLNQDMNSEEQLGYPEFFWSEFLASDDFLDFPLLSPDDEAFLSADWSADSSHVSLNRKLRLSSRLEMASSWTPWLVLSSVSSTVFSSPIGVLSFCDLPRWYTCLAHMPVLKLRVAVVASVPQNQCSMATFTYMYYAQVKCCRHVTLSVISVHSKWSEISRLFQYNCWIIGSKNFRIGRESKRQFWGKITE